MKIHDVPCGGIFGGIGEIAESKIPPNVVRGSIPTLINRYPHRRAERCLLKPNAGLFFFYMAFHKSDDRSSNPDFSARYVPSGCASSEETSTASRFSVCMEDVGGAAAMITLQAISAMFATSAAISNVSASAPNAELDHSLYEELAAVAL
jgi:hypothetical protein